MEYLLNIPNRLFLILKSTNLEVKNSLYVELIRIETWGLL